MKTLKITATAMPADGIPVEAEGGDRGDGVWAAIPVGSIETVVDLEEEVVVINNESVLLGRVAAGLVLGEELGVVVLGAGAVELNLSIVVGGSTCVAVSAVVLSSVLSPFFLSVFCDLPSSFELSAIRLDGSVNRLRSSSLRPTIYR